MEEVEVAKKMEMEHIEKAELKIKRKEKKVQGETGEGLERENKK